MRQLLACDLEIETALQDRDEIKLLLARARGRFPRLRLIWADAAVGRVRSFGGWLLQLVRKRPDRRGFQLLPRRRVVERNFDWLVRHPRLARNYERMTISSEAMVRMAMMHNMI